MTFERRAIFRQDTCRKGVLSSHSVNNNSHQQAPLIGEADVDHVRAIFRDRHRIAFAIGNNEAKLSGCGENELNTKADTPKVAVPGRGSFGRRSSFLEVNEHGL